MSEAAVNILAQVPGGPFSFSPCLRLWGSPSFSAEALRDEAGVGKGSRRRALKGQVDYL